MDQAFWIACEISRKAVSWLCGSQDVAHESRTIDGAELHLEPFTYGRGRFLVYYDKCGCDSWEFPDLWKASIAYLTFQIGREPLGWCRHTGDGKPDRRRPDGDPEKEYVKS